VYVSVLVYRNGDALATTGVDGFVYVGAPPEPFSTNMLYKNLYHSLEMSAAPSSVIGTLEEGI
jgi:hypothetical protein